VKFGFLISFPLIVALGFAALLASLLLPPDVRDGLLPLGFLTMAISSGFRDGQQRFYLKLV
jgi:hypothetical protein